MRAWCYPALLVLRPEVWNAQAHDAAITKISWAHPEFGNIIASSSFDRTIKVWEQTSFTDLDISANVASSSSSASRWVERAVLVDAKGTVRAVEFAPHHFGLKMVRVLPLCVYKGVQAVLTHRNIGHNLL